MTLWSKAGGYTLIELMVVFILLISLSAVLAPLLLPSAKRTLQEAVVELTTSLRETRRLARAQQSRKRFLVDTHSGRYGAEHAPQWHSLPSEVTAELTTARSLVSTETRGGIDFFPDGSSTGGRIELSSDGHAVRVDIEWLTGRIRVRREGT